MVLDINMEDFRRRAKLFVGGHMTWFFVSIIHASSVLRETIYNLSMIAALNYLVVMTAETLNVYVSVVEKEAVWTMLGLELSEDTEGHPLLNEIFMNFRQQMLALGEML